MARVVKTQVEQEGRVIEERVLVEGPELAPWPQEADLEIVGKPVARVDGFERVTGRAVYTYDVQPPGMLCGKVLRCPFAHARIKSVDTSRAQLLPGVRAVLSYVNVPAIRWKDGQLLLDTVARYQGYEVAAVAADDEHTAEDALVLINVEYEELPFVLDPEKALQPDAPQLHSEGNLVGGRPRVYQRGDLQQGWAEAEATVEETFRTQAALHNPLEPHGTVAQWDGECLTVWDSTQHVYGVQAELAEMLSLSLNQVRVICQYMGGGFGSKQEVEKQALLAALLAKMSGRSVKIMLGRDDENLVAGHRHPTLQRIKIGARRDGTLTAMHLHAVTPVGAHGSSFMVEGPVKELYLCPNVRTELYAVRTNLGPAKAFRAPGYVEGTFALESAMDMLAERLGMDPLELRLKNYADRDQMNGGEYSAKNLRQAYQLAAEKIGWSARPENGSPRTEAHIPFITRKRGIGMASQIWGGGGGPPAYAVVKVNSDGTAQVVTGSQDIGTGTRTGVAQIAAEELGFPMDRVQVLIGDSQSGYYAPVSAGSRTISSLGPAVRSAAAEARRQLVGIAAQVLRIPSERVELKEGYAFDAASPDQRRSIAEILSTFSNPMVIGKGSRGPNPNGYVLRTFGAQFAEVEVDVDTGQVRVLRVVGVHDCGRVINPKLVESQFEGGIIQGVGYALTEERVVDRQTGRVLNPGLEEYLVPTSMDVPDIDASALDQMDPNSNNLGAKGVGEPPIIPTAPAIANAIYNATGVRLTSLPMSVYQFLQGRSAP